METKILKRWTQYGIECVILSIGGRYMCAYVGVSSSHPIAQLDYDSLPLSCHGGLTFGGSFEKLLPELGGFYFYGWDYAHAGDFVDYGNLSRSDFTDKKWTLEEVEKETKDVSYDFKKLVELAEKITSNQELKKLI